MGSRMNNYTLKMIAIEVQWPQLFAFVRCCCYCFELIWECLWLFLSFSFCLYVCVCVCVCYARNVSKPSTCMSMCSLYTFVFVSVCMYVYVYDVHTCVHAYKLRRLIEPTVDTLNFVPVDVVCVLLLNYVCGYMRTPSRPPSPSLSSFNT